MNITISRIKVEHGGKEYILPPIDAEDLGHAVNQLTDQVTKILSESK